MAKQKTYSTQIGNMIEDGTLYAGISPETGQYLFVALKDAPRQMNWQQAKEYAAYLDAHGHIDWRLPAIAELKVLFNNRAKICGFKEDSAYWSSTGYDMEDTWLQNDAWAHTFGSGGQGYTNDKNTSYNVRCVRQGGSPSNFPVS